MASAGGRKDRGPSGSGSRAIVANQPSMSFGVFLTCGNGEKIDHCLVGEPTSPSQMGEMMKIGRRGSMNAKITATGIQGHSAYPAQANNPIVAMVKLLDKLALHQLDTGTEHFDPSTLAITSVDTGNKASNVIPAVTKATVNIRFNDSHSGSSLVSWLNDEIKKVSVDYGIKFETDFK